MRFNFCDDFIPRLSEPRLSYKMLGPSTASPITSEKKVEEQLTRDHSQAKKMVIESNFNFLYEFIQTLVRQVKVLPRIDQDNESVPALLNTHPQTELERKNLVDRLNEQILRHSSLVELMKSRILDLGVEFPHV